MTPTRHPEAAKILERKIASQPRVTLTEASALTGLPLDQAETGLREMVNLYDCRLQVTENGDLIYDFGGGLHRRGDRTWREHADDVLAWLWKAFTYVLKAGIAVMLVVYTLIFLVLLIVVVIAMFSKGSDSDSDLGDLFKLPLYLLYAIFEWHTTPGVVTYGTDAYGYQYRRYEPKRGLVKKDKKGFIPSVYDFVFGPPRVEPDALANVREAAAFIRQNKGILVPSELKALAGFDSEQAALFFSECIARFQGEIKISENGIMYGEFDRLLRTVERERGDEIVYYWNEYEPDYLLTGNTGWMNAGVAGMNAFNLIGSVVLASVTGGGAVLLGVIPLIFSTLFFAVPLGRWIKIQFARERRHENNIRKRIMGVVFQQRGAPLSVQYVTQAVNADPRTEKLSSEVVMNMLERLRRELPGDYVMGRDGQQMYAFPVIGMEIEEAERLRRRKAGDSRLGAVVFDSARES